MGTSKKTVRSAAPDDTAPAKRPRGRPFAERRRTATVRTRAYREWADWLTAISLSTGLDASEIIGQAVAAWAAARGLEPPPER